MSVPEILPTKFRDELTYRENIFEYPHSAVLQPPRRKPALGAFAAFSLLIVREKVNAIPPRPSLRCLWYALLG